MDDEPFLYYMRQQLRVAATWELSNKELADIVGSAAAYALEIHIHGDEDEDQSTTHA